MVYIVTNKFGVLSVCGDLQTAKWEKELFELNDSVDVKIIDCSVVSYDEEYYKKEIEMHHNS